MKVINICENDDNNIYKFFELRENFLAIKIPNFISKENAHNAINKAFQFGFKWRYANSIGNIGSIIYQYKDDDKKAYFHDAIEYQKLRNWIFSKNDPTYRLIELLNKANLRANIAKFKDKQYSSGSIQIQQCSSKVHIDNVCLDGQKWSVSKNQISQYSCVLMLNKPESGGELRIFDRTYHDSDNQYFLDKKSGIRRGMDTSIVSNCEYIDIDLEVGDLFIFPTHYYHQVLDSQGVNLRVSALTFLSLKDNKIVETFI